MFKRIMDFISWNSPGNTKLQARYAYKWFESFIKTIEFYIGDVKGKSILDIGCGRRYPLTLLLHNVGANVTGIDVDVIQCSSLVQYLVTCFRELDATATLKKSMLKCLNPLYFGELTKAAGFIPTAKLDIRLMDAAAMEFEDETFDLVVSHAVFEHVRDVPRALAETKRVMKKGAFGYHSIHLFASLTGGHNVIHFFRPDMVVLKNVPPWDHLRYNRYPAHVYLNKYREMEFKKAFQKEFEIVEWRTESEEPGGFLTNEIREELSDYTEEELHKRTIIAIVRRGN